MTTLRKKMVRTTAGLSEVLLDEMDNLLNGESTPQMASAKSRLANSVLAISRAESDAARFIAQEQGKLDGLAPLRLGLR